ncbi:hypothetical protein MSI_15410 [Treponema sp. JC4]|uniref:hypothetical protein n=1 Tax=Treponema sp. JC4 TaxID=1124982 RepID=UPI00025B0A90|nr:hypothetical protein [Treponema sp. JC4]EID84945.1 hypothetical protein MSI_15410 [Treponema sp. JC4]
MKKGIPVARVKMIEWNDRDNVLSLSKNPDKEDCSEVDVELVANCDRLDCVAAI